MTDLAVLDWLFDHEPGLWVAAVLLYGVGDTVTTLGGLTTADVTEAGPIAGPVIAAYGPLAFLLVKVGAFVFFYLVWRVLHTPARVAVPLALVVVGGGVTAWNVAVILSSH